MHELSIALSIVDIAESEARRHQAKAVEKIELEIGALSGVEIDALTFVWPAATKETVLSSARRVIHQIPGMAKCTQCDKTFEVANLYDACPVCGDYFWEILSGKELKVKTLTLLN